MEEKRGLTLEELQNIPDLESNGNREKYFEYPVEELSAVLQEAIKNKEFKIARFLLGVLENNKNTNGQLTTALNSEDITADKPKLEETARTNGELVRTDGEFVNRYKDEQKALDWIKRYFENREDLNVRSIMIGYDENQKMKTIAINSSLGVHGYRVINEETGELEEVQKITQKIKENQIIREISEVGDYWQIEVLPGKENGKPLHYVVDKNFNEVVALGEESGNGTLSINEHGYYEYRRKYEDKVSSLILNKDMEEIASYENDNSFKDRITVEYFDDSICVCDVKDNMEIEYKVYKGGELIFEGKTQDLEKELGGEDFMEGYINRCRKTDESTNNSNSEGGSEQVATIYEDVNNCIFTYNKDRTSFTIKNKQGRLLFKLSDIKKDNQISAMNCPHFRTDGNDNVFIENWSEESNILAIRFNDEMIYINKTTGKRLHGNATQVEMAGKLLGISCGEDKFNIYDQDLECIGVFEEGERRNSGGDYTEMGFIPFKANVDGKDVYYIASIETGEKLTPIIRDSVDEQGEGSPYLETYEVPGYFDEKGDFIKEKRYLICKIPDANSEGETLAQVQIY